MEQRGYQATKRVLDEPFVKERARASIGEMVGLEAMPLAIIQRGSFGKPKQIQRAQKFKALGCDYSRINIEIEGWQNSLKPGETGFVREEKRVHNR